MSELYMMVTITNRKYMSRFAALYRENQIEVGTVSLGMGTALIVILYLAHAVDRSAQSVNNSAQKLFANADACPFTDFSSVFPARATRLQFQKDSE